MNLHSNCPDCGTAVGQPHEDECDIQRCSSCGQQRLTCECENHDPMKSVWTGEWPTHERVGKAVELVYCRGWNGPTPHRIVKKTAKRIYVEAKQYAEHGHSPRNWRDAVASTFVLDRVEFETTGMATRGGGWYSEYFADAAEADVSSA